MPSRDFRFCTLRRLSLRMKLVWLQLVKTPDNHLTGQLVRATLDANAKISQQGAAVTGVVDHNNVVLSAATPDLQILTLSGTFDGSQLTLTSGASDPLILRKSDLHGYQTEVKELNIKSKRIIATNAHDLLLAEIDREVIRMRDFNTDADLHLSRLPIAEESLHAISTKMADYVEHERQLAPHSVARSQLAVAVSQASIATSQLHNAAQALESSLMTGVQSLSTESTHLGQRCNSADLADLTSGQLQERTVACGNLGRADVLYRQKVEALSRGLVHFEQTYTQEHDAQESLIQTAEQLQ